MSIHPNLDSNELKDRESKALVKKLFYMSFKLYFCYQFKISFFLAKVWTTRPDMKINILSGSYKLVSILEE